MLMETTRIVRKRFTQHWRRSKGAHMDSWSFIYSVPDWNLRQLLLATCGQVFLSWQVLFACVQEKNRQVWPCSKPVVSDFEQNKALEGENFSSNKTSSRLGFHKKKLDRDWRFGTFICTKNIAASKKNLSRELFLLLVYTKRKLNEKRLFCI